MTMGRGLIIIGYQGIGKSTLAKKFNYKQIIDLDSSPFYVNGSRDDNWYVIYCKIAVELAKQGHTVCVSSHEAVRDELGKIDRKDFDIWLIYPSIKMQDEWLKKLHKRYISSNSEKDYRAYVNALNSYHDSINSLSMDFRFEHCPLETMDYKLEQIIDLIQKISKVRYDLSYIVK